MKVKNLYIEKRKEGNFLQVDIEYKGKKFSGYLSESMEILK